MGHILTMALLLGCGGAPVVDSSVVEVFDPRAGAPSTAPSGTTTTPTNASIQIYAMVLNLSEQGPLEVSVVGQRDWTVGAGEVGAPGLLEEGGGATVELRDAIGTLHDTVEIDLPALGELLFVIVPDVGGTARLAPFLHEAQPSDPVDHVFRVAHAAPGAGPVALTLDGSVPVGGASFAAGDTVDQEVPTAGSLALEADVAPADGLPEVVGAAAAGDGGGSWVFLVDGVPVDGAVDAAWRWRTNGTPEPLP